MRPRCASDRTTPIVPWPHMPRYPTSLKKMTPVAHFGFTGLQSSAPTTTSEPRGSQLTPERNPSYLDRNTPRRSVREPSPKSGPPSRTTRVGSPSVCESSTLTRLTFSDETMKGIVDYFEYKTSSKSVVLPQCLLFPVRNIFQMKWRLPSSMTINFLIGFWPR